LRNQGVFCVYENLGILLEFVAVFESLVFKFA